MEDGRIILALSRESWKIKHGPLSRKARRLNLAQT
jgi:hypothetical protein